MTVLYRNASGVDFDSLFDPYVQGSVPANTGFRAAGGVDLAGRYAPLSFGSKRANVAYRLNGGTDVTNLWSQFGSALYTIAGLNGKALSASDGAVTDQPTVYAQVQVQIKSDGTWAVFGANSFGNFPQSAPTTGTWLPAGESVANFEVQFVVVDSGYATRVVTNGAAAYSSCSTTRVVSFELPAISANNALERSAECTITINLRKIGQSPSVTTVTGSIGTNGYL